MWLLVLLVLGAAPAWAEDLGELSANPVGLSLIPLVYLVCLCCSGFSEGVSNLTNKCRSFHSGQDPQVAPETVRKGLFFRFYGHEFDTDIREQILAAIEFATHPVAR